MKVSDMLLLAFMVIGFPACTLKPSYKGADGSVLTAGVSIFTKNASEKTTVTHPSGLSMTYSTTNHDETVVPKAVISSKTTLGLGGLARDAYKIGAKKAVDLGAQDVTKHGVSTAADVEKLKILNPVEEAVPAAVPAASP